MDGVNLDPDESVDPVLAGELALERHHLSLLYTRLDALTAEATQALDRTQRDTTTGTPASRMERDAFAPLYADRVAQLRAVEERLCFGRLDLSDGTRAYVGRVGLPDADGARLMLDWRAPGAQAFYRATPAFPDGVLRRRHLVTAARTVTAPCWRTSVRDLKGGSVVKSVPASLERLNVASSESSTTAMNGLRQFFMIS